MESVVDMNRRTLIAGISLPLVGGGVVVARLFDSLRDKDFPSGPNRR